MPFASVHDPAARPSSSASAPLPEEPNEGMWDPTFLDVAPWDEPRRTLSRAVVRDLTALRSTLIRERLKTAPETALAVGVFALLRHGLSGHEASGLSLSTRPAGLTASEAETDSSNPLIIALRLSEPELLAWCLEQEIAPLLEAFARIVAGALDLTHEDASIEDRCKQALADQIAVALDLDLRRCWAPDTAFWKRLPKAALLAALAQAPSAVAGSDAERARSVRAMRKASKSDLVLAVEQALKGTAWLPSIVALPQAQPLAGSTAPGSPVIAGGV
jgi:hypothetical protein